METINENEGLTAKVVRHLRAELERQTKEHDERVTSLTKLNERTALEVLGANVEKERWKAKYSELMNDCIEKESKDIDIVGRAYIVGMDAHKNKVKVTVEQHISALGEYQKKCRESEHPPIEELRQLIFDFENLLANLML